MKLKYFVKKILPFVNVYEKIYNVYIVEKKAYKFSSLISYWFSYHYLKKFNCSISPKSDIGVNLICPHPIGIVIGEGVKIGKNVTIYQNVTLGRKNKDIAEYPTIGDNVTIYCNSTIIGNVKIGNNAVIGCNSVVLRDVKDGEVVSGIVK